MKTIKLKLKNNSVIAMGLDEFSGWAALIEAMELIEANISKTTTPNKCIKSNAIVEFVEKKRLRIRDKIASEFYAEAY